MNENEEQPGAFAGKNNTIETVKKIFLFVMCCFGVV